MAVGMQNILQKLQRVVLDFSHSLSMIEATGGNLVQVWVLIEGDDKTSVLTTESLPFCISGMAGDLLALYRCASVRYRFPVNAAKTDLISSVYRNHEVHMLCNVKDSDESRYFRARDAQRCNVGTSLMAPVFTHAASVSTHSVPGARETVAVFELVSRNTQCDFPMLMSLLRRSLQSVGLSTCSGDDASVGQLAAQALQNQTLAQPVDWQRVQATPRAIMGHAALQGGELFQRSRSEEAGGQPSSRQQGRPSPPSAGQLGGDPGGEIQEDPRSRGAGPENKRQQQDGFRSGSDPSVHGFRCGSAPSGQMCPTSFRAEINDHDQMSSSDNDDEDKDRGDAGADKKGSSSSSLNKAGLRITLNDLHSNFNVNIKEAAVNLGVSVTTLKRASRRHGIQRWPRRQMAKLIRSVAAGSSGSLLLAAAPLPSLLPQAHPPGDLAEHLGFSGEATEGQRSSPLPISLHFMFGLESAPLLIPETNNAGGGSGGFSSGPPVPHRPSPPQAPRPLPPTRPLPVQTLGLDSQYCSDQLQRFMQMHSTPGEVVPSEHGLLVRTPSWQSESESDQEP